MRLPLPLAADVAVARAVAGLSRLVGAGGGTATLHPTTLAKPGFLAPASFTSGGARTGDSWLKPDVTAPGVSIFSAGIGTGNSFAVISGTSMASPHVAGVAALLGRSGG